ncbi:hypothetical protein GCK32_018165 [Trichostrongylus colubriformis]|uniref:Uncharacterized protein n=1 Tax=Trichostrongylus colubriformis TaxID=6319 RepID=A0AAN8FX52_TRICO
MVEGWQLCVFSAMLANVSAAYLINLCAKKKDKLQQGSGSADSRQPPAGPPIQPPRPPTQGGIAGTYDPNYQTLANIQGDVFGADKKGGPAPAPPKPPAQGGIAGMVTTF